MNGEQSAQPNSQPQQEQQTPQDHEREMEDRILNLLDPQGQPQGETPAPKQEPQAKAEESKDQPEPKAEVKQEALPETEEVEYEGEKFRVPAKLKDAFLRQQDYTKKTQDLARSSQEAAEVRKNFETALQQANHALELQKPIAPLMGKLYALDDQLAQYEKIDWNALTAQDQTRALQLSIAYQQAREARGKVLGEIQAAQSQHQDSLRKALGAKLEEGRKALAREIPGWNDELGQKLSSFGQKTYGFSAEELASVSDPRAVKLLHDAYQHAQALEAAKKIPEKKAPTPAPTLKPTGSDSASPEAASYKADRQALRTAKTDKDRQNAAEKLILRKLG